MLLGTISLMPGLRYRLSIALWTKFIVFYCQVVEWVLIFANPVFKKPGLATELATFAISARKHGGQSWMNFSVIWKTSLQIHDIWKDREFSKWLLSPLDQKTFQELVFKAVKNRKRSG